MEDSKPTLDDQDESVRIAVRALGDMRNSAGASRPPPPPSSRDSSSDTSSPAFVERMSHLPFVNSALRVYEQGKASSRMVKYGAEMVESSVKTMVINRLPNQLDEFACRQLDRLDRYRHPSGAESQPPSSSTSISPDPSHTDRERGRQRSRTKTLDGSVLEEDDEERESSAQRDGTPASVEARRRYWRENDRDVPGWLDGNSPFITLPPPPPDSRSSTPIQNGDESRSEKSDSQSPNNNVRDERQVAQRSRWQAMLLEAGGLSAALSEESMRRLKYCLQWLQYATAYIDAHILFLRNFTADLQPLPSPSDTVATTRRPRPPISDEHMRRLMDVRRDIVHTIRQVVDIVSKYAGGALPEPAKTRVRGFILSLPQRWASKAGSGGSGSGSGSVNGGERDSTVTAAASGTGATRRPVGGGGAGQRRAAALRGSGLEGGLRSGASSRAPSPVSSSSSSTRVPRGGVNSHLRHGSGGGGGENGEGGGENGRVSAGTALLTAQRILALATESLDMMRNVTGVMKDSLDRAEAWVGRLRTVGIQRDTQQERQGEDVDGSEYEFSHRNNSNSRRGHHHHHHHHNRSGSSSQYDEHELTMPMPPSPFFSCSGSASGASSTTWGSSVPSTPGGGAYTPVYTYAGAPSPGGMIAMGMSISGERYGTPRSGFSTLPGEEEEEEEEEEVGKAGVNSLRKMEGGGQVRVNANAEVGGGEEDGLKMDVDS